MASMIETLLGEGVRRRDNKLLITGPRLNPTRSRDFFGILMNLGQHATLKTIGKGTDLRDADPRLLFQAALDRWPTSDELAECEENYQPAAHMRDLVISPEFWQRLPRRVCDAYPERVRQLFVRIPRCAGRHFLAMAAAEHPIFPASLYGTGTAQGLRERGEQINILGRFLSRFSATRTIMLVQPALAAFREVPKPPVQQDSTLPWDLNAPPHRSGDRLFTIIREPRSLILSHANALAAALSNAPSEDDQETASWRRRVPASVLQGNPKDLARVILNGAEDRNPICSALGASTAQEALRICYTTNIEITDLEHYPVWVRYTWNVEPAPPSDAAPPILTWQELNPAEQASIQDRIAEDTILYERARPFIAKAVNGSVKGAEL